MGCSKLTTSLARLVTLLLVVLLPKLVAADNSSSLITRRTNEKNYTLADLKPCPLSTLEMAKLGPLEDLEPCIVFQVDPALSAPLEEGEQVSVIPIVQVTPSNCGNQRDGSVTGVQILNADNAGKGFAIGFQQNHYVRFAFTSVIAGNPATLSEAEYDRRHDQLLRDMLQTLQARYIVGSCSFASAVEKEPARDHQAMVLTQVGPPGFYKDGNPYVFGFHINSDSYPLPNVQSLDFWAQRQPGGAAQVPVRVVYRTKSEFFYSTCRSAIDKLRAAGFTDLQEILYDHAADHDGDGVTNQFDEDFLVDLANQACPPQSQDNEEPFHPALFVCTLTEHDILIRQWAENGCRPVSTWLTASTWGWANANTDVVPYYQGGGQWHRKFDYSDKYFDSGLELLAHNSDKFGYNGDYDQVVSYAIPVLFASHLIATYRIIDDPNPIQDFATPEGRERLRRDMMILNTETIFGPIVFDSDQRNVGRGAAGTQWQPVNSDDEDANQESFFNALVSPFLQAETSTVIPAGSALPCEAGNFANNTLRLESRSILSSGCMACPVDTFTLQPSLAFQCTPCPAGSTTDGYEGHDKCYAYDDNLLPPGILALGYIATCTTWTLAIAILTWMYYNRNDPVVKVSQIEFLVLICLGAMISSSTVVALSIEAGSDEDTSAATTGCRVAPFLYTIGWVLQYSSLSAKTYRLYQTMLNTKRMKREAVTFYQMARIVVACLIIDLVVVTIWTIKSPMTYERTEESTNVDDENGIVTISTVGRCQSTEGDFWHYVGPLLGFHFALVVCTNILLFYVRDVADRYQEQKYVAMASGFMLEILLVGIPVMLSVKDSAEATFIVMTAIIAMDDIAVLCCIFGPKVVFQRKGLQEGIGFGESIMKTSHKRASQREFSRRGISSASQGAMEDEETGSQQHSNGSSHHSPPAAPPQRDSFLARVTGDPARKFIPRPLISDVLSGVDSIREETSNEIVMEMASEEMCAPLENQSPSRGKMAQNSGTGMMMTPAGMVKPDVYARELSVNSEMTDENGKVIPGVSPIMPPQSPQSGSVDVTAAWEEQQRLLSMTQALMEEHERMLHATKEMSSEYNRLKGRLEDVQSGVGDVGQPRRSESTKKNGPVSDSKNLQMDKLETPSELGESSTPTRDNPPNGRLEDTQTTLRNNDEEVELAPKDSKVKGNSTAAETMTAKTAEEGSDSTGECSPENPPIGLPTRYE